MSEFDLNKEMTSLLDSVTEFPTAAKLKAAKPQVDKIAEYCRKNLLYQRAAKKSQEIFKDQDAFDVFMELLAKVAAAPLQAYVTGTAIILMPVVSDKLALEAGKS